jgi:hypothetical protein
MFKLAITGISAALTIATANPAIACGGSGYHPAHHSRPAAPVTIKATTRIGPARSAESKVLEATEPVLASRATI